MTNRPEGMIFVQNVMNQIEAYSKLNNLALFRAEGPLMSPSSDFLVPLPNPLRYSAHAWIFFLTIRGGATDFG